MQCQIQAISNLLISSWLISYYANHTGESCTQLPLQVNLSLWCDSLGFCFFLLFWCLDTDWISWGCAGGILSRCCSLPAPSGPCSRRRSSLFIRCGHTCSVFGGSTASGFIGGGLRPCRGVWGHAVLCAVTCRSSTLLPTGLSCFLLKESKKTEWQKCERAAFLVFTRDISDLLYTSCFCDDWILFVLPRLRLRGLRTHIPSWKWFLWFNAG